jgi:hypothetical protein
MLQLEKKDRFQYSGNYTWCLRSARPLLPFKGLLTEKFRQTCCEHATVGVLFGLFALSINAQ